MFVGDVRAAKVAHRVLGQHGPLGHLRHASGLVFGPLVPHGVPKPGVGIAELVEVRRHGAIRAIDLPRGACGDAPIRRRLVVALLHHGPRLGHRHARSLRHAGDSLLFCVRAVATNILPLAAALAGLELLGGHIGIAGANGTELGFVRLPLLAVELTPLLPAPCLFGLPGCQQGLAAARHQIPLHDNGGAGGLKVIHLGTIAIGERLPHSHRHLGIEGGLVLVERRTTIGRAGHALAGQGLLCSQDAHGLFSLRRADASHPALLGACRAFR